MGFVKRHRKKAIFLGIAIMGILASGGVSVAEDYQPTYRDGYGAMDITEGRAEAIEAFPDVQSCLKPAPEDTAKDIPALYHIDWNKIDNDDEAEICLFRIFKELGNPESVIGWLKYQGFKTWGPIKQGSSATTMRRFGFDIRSNLDGYGGSWSLENDQFPKYPTSGLWRYFIRWRAHAQTVAAIWFPDGKLMRVSIGYITE
ncbi:MAG: hypothetical protein V7701_17390 [Sneathiella sp.]